MADSDQSINVLRYNQITQNLEAFGGGSPQWTLVTLKNVDPTQVPVTRLINTTAPLTGGGNLSADRTLAMPVATASVDGYLFHTDWSTFNGKQPAGSYITALTGDVTAAGPGSVAATVATVGGKTASQVSTGVDQAGTAVQRAGDTMTGDLVIARTGSNFSVLALEPSGAPEAGEIDFRNPDHSIDSFIRGTPSDHRIDINSTGLVSLSGGGSNGIQIDPTFGVFIQALTGAIQPAGLMATQPSTETASFNPVTGPDHSEVYLCDATGGVITVSLPDITSGPAYRFTFNKIDSSANTVIITAFAGQTINGAATQTLTAQYQSISIVTDSLNWFITAKV